MFDQYKNKKLVKEALIIIPILFIFIFFLYSLIKDIRAAHQMDLTQRREFILRQNKLNTVSDVNYIQPWMTFHYINTIFSMPENYLKDSLKITDTRYPNLTLSKYIKNNKFDQQTYITELKQAVRDFIARNPAS